MKETAKDAKKVHCYTLHYLAFLATWRFNVLGA
jgi:hypothetical protein